LKLEYYILKAMKYLKKLDYKAGYEKYLYTGFAGFLMRRNHINLSSEISGNLNNRILEIGGGANPHFKIIDLENVNEYWISDNEYLLKETYTKNDEKLDFKIFNHNAEADSGYSEFFKKNIKFNRIIASHVWEHLPNPEEIFLKWINLLDENGRLDIAIPCDPGILFRLGQLVGRKKAMKNYGMSFKEVELMLSREHINSCQNLLKIVKFYTDSKYSYFPFRVPSVNLNLFIFIKVYKNDFI